MVRSLRIILNQLPGAVSDVTHVLLMLFYTTVHANQAIIKIMMMIMMMMRQSQYINVGCKH